MHNPEVAEHRLDLAPSETGAIVEINAVRPSVVDAHDTLHQSPRSRKDITKMINDNKDVSSTCRGAGRANWTDEVQPLHVHWP